VVKDLNILLPIFFYRTYMPIFHAKTKASQHFTNFKCFDKRLTDYFCSCQNIGLLTLCRVLNYHGWISWLRSGAGDKPEIPGYCVREKDLQPCDDSDDCQRGTRCLPLGRSSEMYCLPSRGRRSSSDNRTSPQGCVVWAD